MLNLVLAALILLLAAGLLVYLLQLVFSAASFPVGNWVERLRFGRYVARARRCDALVQQGRADQALKCLRTAFYLHPVHDRSLATAVANHHTGILSRVIALTSERHNGSVRLLSLAKTDRLLTERSELQRRFVTARQSPRKQMAHVLRLELHANGRQLAAAVAQLIEEARAMRR